MRCKQARIVAYEIAHGNLVGFTREHADQAAGQLVAHYAKMCPCYGHPEIKQTTAKDNE